jgi:hypothetical protein
MASRHGINWLTSVKQTSIAMLESRSLKMSLLQSTTEIIEEDYLSGFKTMKMPSLSLFYLERRYGMMMAVRNVDLLRMPRILVCWIQYSKNELEGNPS